jgi:hypothetical protein
VVVEALALVALVVKLEKMVAAAVVVLLLVVLLGP